MPTKVILADDHLIFLESMGMLINSIEGIELIALASNGNEALLAIAREMPHILLCDQEMPILNGLETTLRIKQLYPALKVILLTMYVDTEIAHQAISAGVSGILSKNTSKLELIAAIAAVMANETYFSKDVQLAGLDEKSIPLEPLTSRETEILSCMLNGLSYKMIAEKCGVSYFTVNSHVKHIYKKLGVNSSMEALSKALKMRLLPSRPW